MNTATPWADWLRHAVTVLHLPPAAFWCLSVREWLMLTQIPHVPRLGRHDLETLMTLYPDDPS